NDVDTKEQIVEVTCAGGALKLDPSADVDKMAIIERPTGTGDQTLGLITGTQFSVLVALASTVSHDSNNLITTGNVDDLMAKAANEVANIQGGIVIVTYDKVTKLPLPVAGLMSNAPYEEVGEQSLAINQALKDAGCTMNYAFMTLSLLALIVVPDLRISDKGLIKTTETGFEKVSLFVESK